MSSSPRLDRHDHGAADHAFGALPRKQGMYNPAFEKDACGLAMVATLRGEAGHDIIDLALTALRNLEHRGAIGSDAGTGDGAGILTQMPDAFLRAVVDFELPPVGEYAAGMIFLPRDDERARRAEGGHRADRREREPRRCSAGATCRPPTRTSASSPSTRARCSSSSSSRVPRSAMRPPSRASRSTAACSGCASAPAPSSAPTSSRCRRRTLGYKGMVTTLQLEPFYPDLQDERFASELAVVHSRYSTNTFPSWPLAQPLRMLAHNGEINTVNGNRNWMRARQSQLESELLGDIAPAAADLHRRARATPRRSTRCSSCSP